MQGGIIMGNGIHDVFKLSKIEKTVSKIIKLQKKYGNKDSEINISNRIKLKKDNFKIMIYINNNPWVKIGKIDAGRDFLCGATLGLIDSHLRFVTTDETATSQDFVDRIYKEMQSNLPKLEEELKRKSKGKWSN